MNSGIYIITNNNEGSSTFGWKYIGKSKTVDKRIPVHFSGGAPNKTLRHAISKYKEGWDVKIIPIDSEHLNEFEVFCISEFRDSGYKLYNVTCGGDGGDTWSMLTPEEKEERKRKRKETPIIQCLLKILKFIIC